MIQIHEIKWNDEQVEHIARHGVTVEEIEQVCYGKSNVEQSTTRGENPLYLVHGQTHEGRHLVCVIIHYPDENAYPVSARDMSAKEKRSYRRWKNR